MNAFRLAVINPNTDDGDTAAMVASIEAALPEARVTALTAERGPRSIEGAYDAAFGALETARLVRSQPDHDAYLIACFGDPGVHAARELTTAPVVGIGEAALTAAAMLARRFAVITTLRRGIPELEDQLAALGLRSRCCGVLATGIGVGRQGPSHPQTTDAISALGRRAVGDLGAEALVLACGATTGVEAAVSEATGVPVTNGVTVGALTAFALWRSGLRTSGVGAYAPPEPIEHREPERIL